MAGRRVLRAVWAGVGLGLLMAAGSAAAAREACSSTVGAQVSAHAIETDTVTIRQGATLRRRAVPEVWRFRPELMPSLDYFIFTLTDRATGQQGTALVEKDGGRDAVLTAFDEAMDGGRRLFFVTLSRDRPQGSAIDGPWITTLVFAAYPFAVLWEIDGQAIKASPADQAPLPPMQPSFAKRFLVLCFPGKAGEEPAFGLIDREVMYGQVR